ncbi:dehydrogenase/reductase SDR family member 12-like [Oscarella lobularis]|uniref:dehydrogenase/reductase SDR family member 12-like n=1 Tax=Oscarella lobularis TaxID=121494 RepID=UPI0033135022
MTLYRKTAFFFKGLKEFTKSGYEKAARSFTETALSVDVSQRSFVVTGANSGLGKHVALDLAKRGASVHMVCRSRERGEAAQKELKDASGNEKIYLHLADMSDLESVETFCRAFQQGGHVAHVLINNAGAMLAKKELTAKGYEKTFATNTLGTYLLTKLMLPILSQADDSRVVIVSSGGMLTHKLDLKDLQLEQMNPFDGTMAYAQTKRQQVVMTHHFAKNLSEETHVRFYSMHPGWADTPGVETSMPSFYNRFHEKFRSVEQGADTIIWLALSKEIPEDGNGKFYCDRRAVAEHLPLAWSKSTAEEEAAFIDRLETMVKGYHI